jgi:hypothetical protein
MKLQSHLSTIHTLEAAYQQVEQNVNNLNEKYCQLPPPHRNGMEGPMPQFIRYLFNMFNLLLLTICLV